jgi:SAM-dependent methyltransferase
VTWLDAVLDAARLGPVLDVACGSGRHALAIAARGAHCVGVDRDAAALASLAAEARSRALPASAIRADLEAQARLPVAPHRCGALLVFRYLWRPLAPALWEALRPGGILVYETFTLRHREIALHPRNPEFLLAEGELPKLFPEGELLAFEETLGAGPPAEALARLVARKPASPRTRA